MHLVVYVCVAGVFARVVARVVAPVVARARVVACSVVRVRVVACAVARVFACVVARVRVVACAVARVFACVVARVVARVVPSVVPSVRVAASHRLSGTAPNAARVRAPASITKVYQSQSGDSWRAVFSLSGRRRGGHSRDSVGYPLARAEGP